MVAMFFPAMVINVAVIVVVAAKHTSIGYAQIREEYQQTILMRSRCNRSLRMELPLLGRRGVRSSANPNALYNNKSNNNSSSAATPVTAASTMAELPSELISTSRHHHQHLHSHQHEQAPGEGTSALPASSPVAQGTVQFFNPAAFATAASKDTKDD
jgi:hypothetical protein